MTFPRTPLALGTSLLLHHTHSRISSSRISTPFAKPRELPKSTRARDIPALLHPEYTHSRIHSPCFHQFRATPRPLHSIEHWLTKCSQSRTYLKSKVQVHGGGICTVFLIQNRKSNPSAYLLLALLSIAMYMYASMGRSRGNRQNTCASVQKGMEPPRHLLLGVDRRARPMKCHHVLNRPHGAVVHIGPKGLSIDRGEEHPPTKPRVNPAARESHIESARVG